MKSQYLSTPMRLRISKQRGVVLFFALVALLAMALAAVALIRSVDTATLIAGNLAFKQSTTLSGDAGTEAGIARLSGIQLANSSKKVFIDATHAFNMTDLTNNPGYHSQAGTLIFTNAATWNDSNSILVMPDPDGSGNSVRFVIERMCRNVGLPTIGNCLFGVDPSNTDPISVPLPTDICDGAGCPPAGRSPLFRITSRITGPKNAVSYVQAFVN